MKLSSVIIIAALGHRKVTATECEWSAARSLDGTCNNLEQEDWGAAGQPLFFRVGQNYPPGDGLHFFRVRQRDTVGLPNSYAVDVSSVVPSPTICLPSECIEEGYTEFFEGIGPSLGANARKISNVIHATEGPKKTETEPGISSMITFLSQFLFHDTSGGVIVERALTNRAGYPDMNDANNPFVISGIPLEPTDDFIFSRPTLGPPLNFQYPTLGVAGAVAERDGNEVKFFNEKTTWVDLDGVYGTGNVISSYIRSLQGGKLALQDYNITFPLFGTTQDPITITVQDLPIAASGLPLEFKEKNRLEVEELIEGFTPTFGDVRNSISTPLMLVNLAFIRYHNHLAESECAHLADDEEIFQCARRLNIAVYQHLVYGEFMQALTGQDLISDYTGYDPSVDPSLSAEFNICSRFHYAQPSDIFQADENCQLDLDFDMPPIPGLEFFGDPPPGTLPFAGIRFNVFPFGAPTWLLGLPGFFANTDPFKQLLRSIFCFEAPKFNEKVDDIVRNQPAGAGGVDIPAVTLARHDNLGVESYYNVHKFVLNEEIYGSRGCPAVFGTPEKARLPDPWPCFKRVVGSNRRKAQQLKQDLQAVGLVGKLSEIPLWTGCTIEAKADGSLLGRTQNELVREQLRRVRDADRFFYRAPGVLTSSELANVESLKLSSIFRIAFADDPAIPDDVLLFFTP